MTFLMPAITSRPLGAVALLWASLFFLAGCQTAAEPAGPGPTARAEGWRVVERVGDVRHLPPGAVSWSPAMSGTLLPPGSQVATGAGGRLILASGGAQISVGTDSRLTLVDAKGQLTQSGGALRYRVGPADGERLRIDTPGLQLEADRAVFDVTVDAGTTEVQVTDGRIAVATTAGDRRTVLNAGHAAQVGQPGAPMLAVRTTPGQPFEPVVEVLQAAFPGATQAAERGPGAEAANETPPLAPLPDHTAMATAARGVKGSAVRPAGYGLPETAAHEREASPAALAATNDSDGEPAVDSDPVDGRQERFDRLTRGLLEGLPAAWR